MKVIRKDVLTVGGVQTQFLGVQVGEFLLVPDSDSGTRPDSLRVKGSGETLLLHGGRSLRVEIHSLGISRKGFLRKLTPDQERLLAEMAFDLPGRICPMIYPEVGELLRKRWEALGEEKILPALQTLFRGVESTMKWTNLLNRIPFPGRRLGENLFPYN